MKKINGYIPLATFNDHMVNCCYKINSQQKSTNIETAYKYVTFIELKLFRLIYSNPLA